MSGERILRWSVTRSTRGRTGARRLMRLAAAALGTAALVVTSCGGGDDPTNESGDGKDDDAIDAESTTSIAAPAAPGVPAGYQLFWSDEFDGTSLDLTRWKPYHNNYGSGNEQLECNTPGNVEVGGGNLTITARKESVDCPQAGRYEYSSAFIGSREAGHLYPTFARYEMRAKLPHGQGLWPAFWLRHAAGAEVQETDVMEYFFSAAPGEVRQSLHFPAEIGTNTAHETIPLEPPVADTGGAFHTFAVDITPHAPSGAKFAFYVDDTLNYEYVPSKFGWLTDHDQNAMFDIAINLAVGGTWNGSPESQLGYYPAVNRCSLNERTPPGNDPERCSTDGLRFESLPATYVVDYVRVYQRTA